MKIKISQPTRSLESQNAAGFCSRETAERLLAWAAEQHGGGWVGHSRTAARVAETIARHCKENFGMTAVTDDVAEIATNTLHVPLNPGRAYVLALLHDIGRYEGNTQLHHTIAGYYLLMRQGYPEEARICLTHSCYSMKLAKNPAYWPGVNDPTELRFFVNFINTVKFNDYDRLIQLADLMSLDAGVFSVNDRFCDSVLRYRLSDAQEDLRARQALKAYFDQKTGMNIYDLFREEIIRHALGV